MGKIVSKAGVIGDFFTDGEEITAGKALARVNANTSANDFAIIGLDASNNTVKLSSAVNFSLIEASAASVSALSADAAQNIVVTGTLSGNAWQWNADTGGAGVAALDTDNKNRLAQTIIEEFMGDKPIPTGSQVTPSSVGSISWVQSESKIYVTIDGTSMAEPTGTEFARMTASSGGRDFGE